MIHYDRVGTWEVKLKTAQEELQNASTEYEAGRIRKELGEAESNRDAFSNAYRKILLEE